MVEGAEARRGRVRLVGWQQLAHGLHAPRGDESLEAWQLLLPASGMFTHVTAAAHVGWWLPPLPDDVPIFAAAGLVDGRVRRPELRVSRHAVLPEPVVVNGVRLAPAAEVLLACARDLCLLDLVPLIDSAVRGDPTLLAPLTTLAGSRRPGAARLRSALAWADPRSESAWETLLRILHEVCGVEVEPQHDVFGPDGVLIGRADLWLVGTRTIHEYDGADHRDAARQTRDLRRDRRLDRGRWVRHGYTAGDVVSRGVTILADADRAVGREHDPSRIRAWHELLRESTLTPAGMARLRRRWRLETGHERQARAV